MENYFSANLKYLRLKRKLTQTQLAKKLDKDYSTIGKWELGQRSPIMLDVLKIADFFDIPLEKLINVNLSYEAKNQENDFNLFYEANKHLLTDDDKEHIVFMINKRKKERG